jgi:hypothetical protein
MTPPEEHNRYREQIGAFLLGKLDEGERTALQEHLNSCPVCQAEERELEPVVAALSYAAPDRIKDDPRPPGDLEESTLAPILGEMHRARRRRRRVQWSTLAAAAIFVLVIGLAGFTRLLEPAVPLEPLSFSRVAPGVEVEGHLIAHACDTEIRLLVSRSHEGQTHRVTLVSKNGERVDLGTFVGIGDKPLKRTFETKLSREDATRLEVRTTPGGELVFFAKIPERPRIAVRDWPRNILPWAAPGPQNVNTGENGPKCADEPPGEASPAPATPEKTQNGGSGGVPPYMVSPPASGNNGSPPRGDKPGAASPGTASPGTASPEAASPEAASPGTASPEAAPEETEPPRSPQEQPSYEQRPNQSPPPEQPPVCDQYGCQP